MKRVFSWFIKSILQAIGFLLPVGLTLWVMVWLFGYVRNILRALDILSLFFSPQTPWQEFLLSMGSFILMLVFILVVGIILQGILGRWIHSLVDTLMDTLPGVNILYRAIKQLLAFLFKEKPRETKGTGEVVLVKAFHDRVYSMGFVMGKSTSIDPSGKTWLKVFVPGVPNISSGFLMLVEEKDVIKLHTSLDQASAFLVSFGVLKDLRRKP
ncbi:hypothetical protein BREVNS_0402 [Brevinematales bacterium NS]|nr:hypothetical protein BREVNS_0402 [Brevinematales bacterium NS]